MSHKKFGPDRVSRFDVYWMQTNKQTNRHPDRQAKFIYRQTNKQTPKQTDKKPNLYIDGRDYRRSFKWPSNCRLTCQIKP